MTAARGEVDAVVVGGGPAGLAAALWLARYRRSVVVLDSGSYRAEHVEVSHGYLGRDPQQPMDLLARGREELLAYPTASVVGEEVRDVGRVGDRFSVNGFEAARVVLACGVQDAFPDVEGFAEHYGSSVFHCPSCDGYEARDREVVALGWDEQLVGFARSLLTWSRSVTLVTNGHPLRADAESRAELGELGIDVVEEDATAFVGRRGDLRGVRTRSGAVVPASHVFFSVAHAPRNELALSLGCQLDPDGYVSVSSCGETSTSGVYAAGDLVPGLQLVSVAAGSGVVAGVAAAQSLLAAGVSAGDRPTARSAARR